MKDSRRLRDLDSVGPATEADLRLLGVATVDDLRGCDARELYDALCVMTGKRHDPCCEDVFAAAIAQADDSGLPAARRAWPYWSRVRKAREAAGRGADRS